MQESLIALFALFATYVSPAMERLPSELQIGVPQPSKVLAADNSHLFSFGPNPEAYATYEQLGDTMIRAMVAAEDRRFFEHEGLDPKALARAAYLSGKSILVGSTRVQGGSTISQQLAKILYTDRRTNIRRKVAEFFITNEIERNFSKDEIITRYANEIYLGNGVVGVRNASHHYFGKQPAELEPKEAATIAALIRAPESMLRNHKRWKRTRDIVHNFMVADQVSIAGAVGSTPKEKTPTVKKSLLHKISLNMLPDEDALNIENNKTPDRKLRRNYGYFEDQVMRDLRDLLGAERVAQGGLTVRTGYDSKIQDVASHAVTQALTLSGLAGSFGKPTPFVPASDLPSHSNAGLPARIIPARAKNGLAGWTALLDPTGETEESCHIPAKIRVGDRQIALKPYVAKQTALRVLPLFSDADTVVAKSSKTLLDLSNQRMCIPILNSGLGAGVAVVDPRTGAVRALVGGVDYYATKFNRAVQAKRQTGSVLKPFVYLSALEHGYSIDQKVSGIPQKFEIGHRKFWTPSNASSSISSSVKLGQALLHSQNIPTINLAEEMGFADLHDDLSTLNSGDTIPRELVAVLGSASANVRDIAGDYATFINKTGPVLPLTVTSILDDRNQTSIFDLAKRTCSECRKRSKFSKFLIKREARGAWSTQNIGEITKVLKRVPTEGTAKILGQPFEYEIFGKTGTTNSVKDAWFAGGTLNRAKGDLAIATYIGYDQPKRIGSRSSAARLAGPVFMSILAYLDGYKSDLAYTADDGFLDPTRQKKQTGSVDQNSLSAKFDFSKPENRDFRVLLSRPFIYRAKLTGNLVLRTEPNAASKYLVTLYKGAELKNVECLNGWCRAKHLGFDGYFSTRWADILPSQNRPRPLAIAKENSLTAKATNTVEARIKRDVNFRLRAGVNSPKVGVLLAGDRVTHIQCGRAWCKGRSKGLEGWFHKSFGRFNTPAPSSNTTHQIQWATSFEERERQRKSTRDGLAALSAKEVDAQTTDSGFALLQPIKIAIKKQPNASGDGKTLAQAAPEMAKKTRRVRLKYNANKNVLPPEVHTYRASIVANVAFRSRPNVQQSIWLDTLSAGDVLPVVTCRSGWCTGSFQGQQGWFSKRWSDLEPLVTADIGYVAIEEPAKLFALKPKVKPTLNRESSEKRRVRFMPKRGQSDGSKLAALTKSTVTDTDKILNAKRSQIAANAQPIYLAKFHQFSDKTLIKPTFSYKATFVGDVTLREGPSTTTRSLSVIKAGSKAVDVLCNGGWCQGKFADGRKGWFGKSWIRLSNDRVNGGQVAFDAGHPLVKLASNFSTGILSRDALRQQIDAAAYAQSYSVVERSAPKTASLQLKKKQAQSVVTPVRTKTGKALVFKQKIVRKTKKRVQAKVTKKTKKTKVAKRKSTKVRKTFKSSKKVPRKTKKAPAAASKTSKSSKRRCKMRDFDGEKVEVCYNY